MKIINIPNLLTLFRVGLIPILVIIFYVPENTLSLIEKNTLATFTFLLAAITDWLDGFLARRLQQTSKFGAFLDPVADKLIVITALLLLLELGRVNSVIALIIIGREFTVSSLREWMAQLGKSQSIAVAFIGKLKTTAQMAAIIFLLYFENIGFIPTQKIGEILIYLEALLTVVSMFYFKKYAIIDSMLKIAKILPSVCGNSSAGRAIPCQGIGREFEPRFPLHIFIKKGINSLFLCS